MKHLLLTAAAALILPAAAMAQHELQPAVEPIPLPQGIRSVSPEQGFVDTSNNANPLGVQEITLTFNSCPEVNTECAEVAKCYYNGGEEAVATAGPECAYRDNMGVPAGAILFPINLSETGTYHITIPAGMFIVDGEESPAVELNYEIRPLYILSPRQGICDYLSEITLTFPGAFEITRDDSKVVEFSMNNWTAEYGLTPAYLPTDNENMIDRVVFSFFDPKSDIAIESMTEAGTYTFFADAGAFTVKVAGPNYPEDPESYYEFQTPDILRQFIVADSPAPSIDPEQGDITIFDTFTLTPPAGYQVMFVDDMCTSHIYPLKADGSLAPDPVCDLKAKSDGDKAVLTVINKMGQPQPYEPAAGDYVLQLASGVFFGAYNGGAPLLSVPYEYTFHVPNGPVGVECITGATETTDFTVYNLSGIRVLKAADADAVRALPAGFYVVNGKKMVIK